MRIGLNHPDRASIEAEIRGEPERKHKYNAKQVKIDGHTFPSRREANRYRELKILEKGGIISNLELQIRFPLEVNGLHICTYVADFRYWHIKQGISYVEDAKGFKTDSYKIKRRLMLACYGIDVIET